ncbi:MAG: ABC transporter ATP-binding protein [Bacillota bacterium]|jgi:ABC-type Na+ transport system ATPase subunit NatA
MGIAFKVENLRFRYPSSKEDTIKGISFDIREGEVFGFLGPSGAGKSTTQKILIKLLEDYAGNIEYFGKNLKALDKSFYEEIGVGFEMPVHFTKLTALENMKFFSGFYRQTANIQDLMERVGLWDYRDVKVGEFSKGMKVRLNFVRALLNKPRVLFLDEVAGVAHAAIGLVLSLRSRDFTSMLGLLMAYMFVFTIPSILFSLGVIDAKYDWLLMISPSHCANYLIRAAVSGDFETTTAAAACAYLAILAAGLFKFAVYPSFKDNAVRG